MTRYKATQLVPEEQESIFFYSLDREIIDFYFENEIAICGNHEFKEYVPNWKERAFYAFNYEADDIIEQSEYINNGEDECRWFDTKAEIIDDYFERKDGKGISEIDAEKIIDILNNELLEDDDALTEILSVLSGEEYSVKEIHGVLQGDWNKIYYPTYLQGDADAREKYLNNIEFEYFNTGSEWFIYDKVLDEGCSIYVHAFIWDYDGIKEEISKAIGAEISDIDFEKFSGYTKVASYETI